MANVDDLTVTINTTMDKDLFVQLAEEANEINRKLRNEIKRLQAELKKANTHNGWLYKENKQLRIDIDVMTKREKEIKEFICKDKLTATATNKPYIIYTKFIEY